MDEFWSPFLVGGGTRPDAITGLNPDFRTALRSMLTSMPQDLRSGLQILSAFRSPELQAQLYQNALERYGSEAEARRWVAPPGNSRHNYGLAVDFRWQNPAAQEWVHANAANYGLHFPMSWEDWHIEPIGPDGGRVPIDGTWAGMPSAPGADRAGAEQALMAALAQSEGRGSFVDALAGRPAGGGYSRPSRRSGGPERTDNAEVAASSNRQATDFVGLLNEMTMASEAPRARIRRLLA